MVGGGERVVFCCTVEDTHACTYIVAILLTPSCSSSPPVFSEQEENKLEGEENRISERIFTLRKVKGRENIDHPYTLIFSGY